ncbi:MAG TPA: thermonuclease family protein [Mycobacteriales bacterium]|nr:thermonuclease family protein [Mycobacteriales bacterium]
MLRPTRALLALALIALGTAGCGTGATPPPVAAPAGADAVAVPRDAFAATVVRVVDGDTILARVGGRGANLRVRLLGIDSPESVKPDTPVACYGHEASSLTASLLPKGAQIRAAYEKEHQDRYGRELWDVWLPDGRYLETVLAASGTVRPDPFKPNIAYAAPIEAAAREAHDAGRGLWGRCSFHDAFPEVRQ